MSASTDRTNTRKLRHSIRKRVYKALMLTGGQPGLTKEQQVYVVTAQVQLLEEALEKAKTLLQVVETRDFDAHKAAKDAQAQMPDVEKVPASEESQMADLTFEQIVAKLGQADTAETKDDGAEPPF